MTPWTVALQASLSFTISWSLLKLMSIELVMPANHLILYCSLLLLLSIFSQHQGLFQWVSSLHQVAKVLRVSASTSVLPVNIQDCFPLGLTGFSCCPRDSQESSPTPQFKSGAQLSLVISFLCSPTLTSIHDYWKNHSFD